MFRVEFLRLCHTIAAANTMTGVPTVFFSELRSLLTSGRVQLFDVRSREEVEAGTIPGAVNIPGRPFLVLAEGQPIMVLAKGASLRDPENGCIVGLTSCFVSELEIALTMDPATFQALYSVEKPKLEDKNLIFFCQMGKRGFQATQLALSLGYTGARHYAGAYKEWLEKEG